MPEKYLEQPRTDWAEQVKHVNVEIALPRVEDPKAIWGDVPQERLAKAVKASKVVEEARQASDVRSVYLRYPYASDAKVNQL